MMFDTSVQELKYKVLREVEGLPLKTGWKRDFSELRKQ